MSETTTFDVVVLGGGPGGYTAAFRAADLGLSVCLVEQASRLGGVCLNVGCIPSKTLLHGATVMEEARDASAFGITFGPPEIDLDKFRGHKESVIEQLTSGLDKLTAARKVTRLEGVGSFVDVNTLQVEGAEKLEVNRNTVAKAYTELERDGVIETRTGRGSFIRNNQSALKKAMREEIVGEALDDAIVKARQVQISNEELRKLLERRLGNFDQSKEQP